MNGEVAPNPERPRPSRPWQPAQEVWLKTGPRPPFTSAGALTKIASKSASPSRKRDNCSPSRPGSGFSKAVLAASKTVAAPPDRALSEAGSGPGPEGPPSPQAARSRRAPGYRRRPMAALLRVGTPQSPSTRGRTSSSRVR